MARRGSSLKSISRRVFVHRLSFMGGGVVLLGGGAIAVSGGCKDEPKKTEALPQAMSTSHQTFTNDEFAVLSAAVERMLPRDEDPGALDANVPEYIDRILQQQQLAKMKVDFLGGLAALDRRASRLHKVGFAKATPEQQDEVLTIFKDSPEKSGEFKWYELLLTLTMEGFLGDPSYGGNKNKVGWAVMGFDLVGHEAPEVEPGYDGKKHLDHLRCGSGKGC
jgi:gluconate 2-dehydrogenase gamma chain